jgi:hypothetical protein
VERPDVPGVEIKAVNSNPKKSPAPQVSKFVISLDFELMWGVRDARDLTTYGRNIIGARRAIPRLLELFEHYAIRATWATVGFLFCENKDELLQSLPAVRPSYKNPALSNYFYLDEVGYDEKADPYYFGSSLIDMIKGYPSQEIATHTFSHFCCLEPGGTVEQFSADLDAAMAIALRREIFFRSIVFPRNQYSAKHLQECRARGITAFRGNERSWIYRPSARAQHTLTRRLARFTDSHFNLSGHHINLPEYVDGMIDVCSSRFLRGVADGRGILDRLRLRRIMSAMTAAARLGGVYHLWWHPHNFGRELDANIRFLGAVLEHYRILSDRYGMESWCMSDFTKPAVDE